MSIIHVRNIRSVDYSTATDKGMSATVDQFSQYAIHDCNISSVDSSNESDNRLSAIGDLITSMDLTSYEEDDEQYDNPRLQHV